MKYIHYIAAIIALGFLTSRAEAKLGPVVINLIASQQSVSGTFTSTTNITATTTNITATIKYVATNNIINNAKILKMLANSFNTNLPATAALKLDEDFNLVVAVGTNVILNASTVATLPFPGPSTATGAITYTSKKTPTVTSDITRVTYSGSATNNFGYDDSGKTTTDGTHTKFKVEGFQTIRTTGSGSDINGVENALVIYIITLTGGGEGIISGKDAVIKGSVTGSVITPNLSL